MIMYLFCLVIWNMQSSMSKKFFAVVDRQNLTRQNIYFNKYIVERKKQQSNKVLQGKLHLFCLVIWNMQSSMSKKFFAVVDRQNLTRQNIYFNKYIVERKKQQSNKVLQGKLHLFCLVIWNMQSSIPKESFALVGQQNFYQANFISQEISSGTKKRVEQQSFTKNILYQKRIYDKTKTISLNIFFRSIY
eukprot:TRINITY_DN6390_c1_g2_i1.p1 TRINITY_DN6390_c1_g2~~TRINITY_DN6390_c1_g2_i1.p1  ORF type:complete len:189 (+),score=3.47 TRINITY_DN6390_c1_g2_i1:189-755(+)